jgi:hypothetical protein
MAWLRGVVALPGLRRGPRFIAVLHCRFIPARRAERAAPGAGFT